MLIKVNSDRRTEVSAADAERLEEVVRERLARFGDWLTRVEVHLTDPDGPRSQGTDARCALEARPEGRDPVATTAEAADPDAAVAAAARAMVTVLERERGRLTSRKGH